MARRDGSPLSSTIALALALVSALAASASAWFAYEINQVTSEMRDIEEARQSANVMIGHVFLDRTPEDRVEARLTLMNKGYHDTALDRITVIMPRTGIAGPFFASNASPLAADTGEPPILRSGERIVVKAGFGHPAQPDQVDWNRATFTVEPVIGANATLWYERPKVEQLLASANTSR